MASESQKGLRHNKGKNRLELLSPFAEEELGKVFTKGAEKYEDHNWTKGLSFMDTVGCLKRHLQKFLQGVELDEETGCLHIAHVAWNAMALVHFVATGTGNDDRPWKAMMKRELLPISNGAYKSIHPYVCHKCGGTLRTEPGYPGPVCASKCDEQQNA